MIASGTLLDFYIISSLEKNSTKKYTESTYDDGIVSEVVFVGEAKMTKTESMTLALQFTKENKPKPRDA